MLPRSLRGALAPATPADAKGLLKAAIRSNKVEVAHGALRAAPGRVAGLDVPLAYDAALENAALPNVERIVTAIRAVLA